MGLKENTHFFKMEMSMSETLKQWINVKFWLGIHSPKVDNTFFPSYKADGDPGVNKQD